MALAASRLLHQIRFNSVVIQTAAGDVTMANEGAVFVNKTSGAATQVTLTPNPSTTTLVLVQDAKGDAGTNNITVVGDSGDTINGAASYVIGNNFGGAIFAWNGTSWNVTAVGDSASQGAGVVADVEGLTVAEYGSGAQHRTVFTFDGVALSTLDNGTAGHGGGVKIYDFPQGAIAVLGTTQDWSLLTVDGTGLPNDAVIDIGVGTTVATSAMESLTTTTQDIVNKDDITFSSSLSAVNQFLSTMSANHQLAGETTAVDAYLNLACTAATADGDGTITLTGTVTIVWANLGAASS